ncbi:hypothetical protein EJ05DRAFT_207434 [Pseudovirgaria hyperparasitica]|uniref:FHA domain-containing protein n=1 Tax=Pseudovirgaria hyperparasitica TaxID=470096 RepID=A0A6A6WJY4_9PEZI|nr:uncharacterized protein EJ05DRAFT_207434 [Pseudovirgaria hyperparasitica]KAF2762367.1 hypothetical protein EJ05DRAFT_207434 [Pseudovirgaria hyperparasitica]
MSSITPLDTSQQPRDPSECSSLARKPSLLPAFELLSSSPVARSLTTKRKYEDDSPCKRQPEVKYYPTPVPTSSTGILPSSPSARSTRPRLQRTASTVSQRAALTAMPSVDLPADGTVVTMGRSSNSSDYQLSVNRLISRVHILASYCAPTISHKDGEVRVECTGANGAKVHCGGRAHHLSKGSTFSSDKKREEIMIDVQDARVVLVWPYVPRRSLIDQQAESAWNVDDSPSRRLPSSPPNIFASSPPPFNMSPASTSCNRQLELAGTFTGDHEIKVYEDADTRQGEENTHVTDEPVSVNDAAPSRKSRSNTHSMENLRGSTQSSALSFPPDDLSDPDEENDPIIHSFGPFGDDILGRMASFSTESNPMASPQRRRQVLKSSPRSPARKASHAVVSKINESPIRNHVINQLAFSRLHSIPLSTIMGNLPAELKGQATSSNFKIDSQDDTTRLDLLSRDALKTILDNIPCVGEIAREGKDAAGKRLENEFYYVPEMDNDQARRDTVTGGLGKTGLRAVRKNHKQYYWKKPRC